MFGSLAGLGGGFLIVPVLRLAFSISPTLATAASLLFVFANTLAASIAFIRRGLVDMRRAIIISVAAIPSSVGGAALVALLPNREFDLVYGIFLIAVGVMIFTRRNAGPSTAQRTQRHELLLQIVTGLFVGFISSFFGIGGGIVLAPIMLVAFPLDAHTVAATTAFVVMLTSPVGVVAHGLYGNFDPLLAAPLALGGFTGGSVGARLARRLHAHHISTLMAVMIVLAALALMLKHLI